jgi:hypothetical protein
MFHIQTPLELGGLSIYSYLVLQVDYSFEILYLVLELGKLPLFYHLCIYSRSNKPLSFIPFV